MCEKCKKPYVEPVFSLSVLVYCKNMAVQHGGPCVRGPTPSVDIKGLLYNKNTVIFMYVNIVVHTILLPYSVTLDL